MYVAEEHQKARPEMTAFERCAAANVKSSKRDEWPCVFYVPCQPPRLVMARGGEHYGRDLLYPRGDRKDSQNGWC